MIPKCKLVRLMQGTSTYKKSCIENISFSSSLLAIQPLKLKNCFSNSSYVSVSFNYAVHGHTHIMYLCLKVAVSIKFNYLFLFLGQLENKGRFYSIKYQNIPQKRPCKRHLERCGYKMKSYQSTALLNANTWNMTTVEASQC